MNGTNSIFALHWTIFASNAFLFQMGKWISISCSCWTPPAVQHHSDVLISSPLLILPFLTAVEYEYDISVEHVYYNSRIPFCNVNTTRDCCYMFLDAERFSSPNSELWVFQTQYVTIFLYLWKVQPRFFRDEDLSLNTDFHHHASFHHTSGVALPQCLLSALNFVLLQKFSSLVCLVLY